MTTGNKSQHNQGKLIIDLTGPDGKASSLLEYAQRLARRLGLDEEAILQEMISGDYETLVKVFEREFGRAVILLKDDAPDMETL